MNVRMRLDDLSDPRIAEFLEEHLREMRLVSPPESVHALDLERLKQPEIMFWSAWNASELVGCGALKNLGAEHAELKSMRTASSCRRKGVGKLILEHLMNQARSLGYRRMSLETGSMAFFEPARSLYASYGFVRCVPFANYKEDPASVCMTRTL